MYFEVSESWLAFSSSAWRACSTSLVLALDLGVLVREQLGLLLERLVRLLQLGRQRLRLLEQTLGAHVGFERVDHDADGLGELIQERLVGRAEPLERRQLDHPAHLALEDHG